MGLNNTKIEQATDPDEQSTTVFYYGICKDIQYNLVIQELIEYLNSDVGI